MRILALITIACLIGVRTAAAAPFVNLGFEDAFGGTDPGGFKMDVPASSAFPGWTVHFNDRAVDTVSFNTYVLDAPGMVLYSASSASPIERPVAGVFGAELRSEFDYTVPEFVTISLSQVGDVPLWARSIHFLTRSKAIPLTLTLDGREIPVMALSSSDGAIELGGDITAFAGKTGELRFSAGPETFASGYLLDEVSFSSIPVPEPTVSLILFGTILVALRVRSPSMIL